jgi:hypothetical protein
MFYFVLIILPALLLLYNAFFFYSIHKQPCLGGDSKTLMFVNTSTYPSLVPESLWSLRFSAIVNVYDIGRKGEREGKIGGDFWEEKK